MFQNLILVYLYFLFGSNNCFSTVPLSNFPSPKKIRGMNGPQIWLFGAKKTANVICLQSEPKKQEKFTSQMFDNCSYSK